MDLRNAPEPSPQNIHILMQRAASANRVHRQAQDQDDTLVIANFKVDPEVKTLAAQICRQNGTTYSAWLRECCRQLCADYLPLKPDERAAVENP